MTIYRMQYYTRGPHRPPLVRLFWFVVFLVAIYTLISMDFV